MKLFDGEREGFRIVLRADEIVQPTSKLIPTEAQFSIQVDEGEFVRQKHGQFRRQVDFEGAGLLVFQYFANKLSGIPVLRRSEFDDSLLQISKFLPEPFAGRCRCVGAADGSQQVRLRNAQRGCAVVATPGTMFQDKRLPYDGMLLRESRASVRGGEMFARHQDRIAHGLASMFRGGEKG